MQIVGIISVTEEILKTWRLLNIFITTVHNFNDGFMLLNLQQWIVLLAAMGCIIGGCGLFLLAKIDYFSAAANINKMTNFKVVI